MSVSAPIQGLTRAAVTADESAAMQRLGRRAQPQPHCCNHKGALIGFLVGTGVAIGAVDAVCDAGDCRGAYARAIAVFGGLGALVGAVAPQTRPPAAFPLGTHVEVSALASRARRGGAVSLRF